MVWIEDNFYTCVEIVEVKVQRNLALFLRDDFEVTFYKIEAFHDTVAFEKASLCKKKHHEAVEEPLIQNEL